MFQVLEVLTVAGLFIFLKNGVETPLAVYQMFILANHNRCPEL